MIEGDEKSINEFREFSENDKYAIDENGECHKWYSHQEEIIKFSKTKPDVIFMLSGEGEESGDAWRIYVKDGHTQECNAEMVYPEFDKGKLLSEIRDKKIDNVLK
jgi:hypothetical protein